MIVFEVCDGWRCKYVNVQILFALTEGLSHLKSSHLQGWKLDLTS